MAIQCRLVHNYFLKKLTIHEEKMKMNQKHHDEPVPSYDVNIYRTELLTNEYFPALLHYLKKKVSISKARRMEGGAKFVQIILLSKQDPLKKGISSQLIYCQRRNSVNARYYFKHFKRQPHEMVKHTQKIRRLTADELLGYV